MRQGVSLPPRPRPQGAESRSIHLDLGRIREMNEMRRHQAWSLAASPAGRTVPGRIRGVRPSASALGWLSLAALIAAGGLGVTALLKRADVAASERDRLIHAQIRQVSETTALTLRQMDQGGRALMVALLRRVAELPDTQDESRVHGTLHTLVRDHPEVRELRARRGDERWVVRRGAPPPPGTPPPELAADAGRAPPAPGSRRAR